MEQLGRGLGEVEEAVAVRRKKKVSVPVPGPQRRPYRPPMIEQIDIASSEAMLGTCKATMGGMGNGGGPTCGIGCEVVGS